MNRHRVDELCARGIAGLVILLFAFGPLAMGAVRDEELALMGGLASLMAVLWLVRIWADPDYRLAWPPMAWGVVAFVVYACIRYPMAPIEYSARADFYRVLIYSLLFFVIINNTRHRTINLIAYVIVGVGVFMSLYGIYQFMTRSDLVWNLVRPAQYAGRGSGTYICPNHLAGYLEFAIPIGLSYIFLGRSKHLAKMILGYAVLVMLGGLGATVSRGGLISAGLSLLLLISIFVFRRNHRKPALVLLGVMVLGAFWFISRTQISQFRFDRMLIDGKLEDVRFLIWKPAVKVWQEDAWLGAGPNQFRHHFRKHRPRQVQMRAERVHNDYLNTLVDWGLVGFVLLAGAVGAFFYSGIHIWKGVHRESDDFGSRSSNRSAFVLAGTIGVVSLLFHSFVDFNLHIPANAVLAVGIMAIVLGIGHSREAEASVRLGMGGRVVLTLVALAGAIWVGKESAAKYREGRLITASNHPDLKALDEIRMLRQLQALEPGNPVTAYRLGEGLRQVAWEKPGDWYPLTLEAEKWLEKAMKLDPNDSSAPLRYGMCRDLRRDYATATGYFLKAIELDPNGAVVMAWTGWHYLQIDDYKKAREYLEKSLRLNWWSNEFASEQLEIVAMFEEPAPAPPPPTPDNQ